MNGAHVEYPKPGPGSFRAKELWGSLFDLWFLIPLVGLMAGAERGGSAALMGRDLLVMGGAWALSALLFRTSLPLQPLKVWAFLFLILRPTPEVASLSAVFLGLLLFLAGHFGLARRLEERLTERSFGRIRRAVTLYVRAVAVLAFGLVLLRNAPGFVPSALASFLQGISPSPLLSVLLLVLPQFPVTLVNGLLATVRERKKEGALSPEAQKRLSGTALARWLGAADLLAGAAGALPFCHGAGNLWVYRRHKIRSLLPSLASSATLAGLGTLLLVGEIPLFSPLLWVSFLAGFLVAEIWLKRRAGVSGVGIPRPASAPDALEIWAMAGGLLSGAVLLGGLPLLLVFLLGTSAAVSVSSGGGGTRVFPLGDCGYGVSVASSSWTRAALSATEKQAGKAVPHDSALFSPVSGFEGSAASPAPLLGEERSTVPSSPERFFRRAREIPVALFLAVLLLIFFSDPSPSPSCASDPDRPCRQTRIHFLLAPLRAP